MAALSPFSIRNVRLFIAFRVLFNSRFYYPVFTILFLDYGLSLEQFALLNTVWAVTIVCAEVPSGALADLLGRKRLLVLTSALMIVEMSVIAFVPVDRISLVFWAFLLNRIVSGLAEAMASGADEALAYDALSESGNPDHWPKVLSVQMRFTAAAGIVSMVVGALCYDPEVVNRLIHWFGLDSAITQQTSMRFPVYLTLVLAILALTTVLRMEESGTGAAASSRFSLATLREAGRVTLEAGNWILQTPFALAIILLGMMYDHVLRMVITLTSQYFRLIDLPEASFGVIMAALSLLGLLIPRLAEFLVATFTPAQNSGWLALITLLALWGLTGFIPFAGIIFVALVMIGMMLTAFFTSHYLNRITSSARRATVLSFKGLAFNLAYGIIGILFAGLIQHLRGVSRELQPEWPAQLIENTAFRLSISWFPWYALILIVVLTLFCFLLLKGTADHRSLS